MILLQVFLLADQRLLFANDKVYAVLFVMLIIWGGMVALLMHLNRKISRLEARMKAR